MVRRSTHRQAPRSGRGGIYLGYTSAVRDAALRGVARRRTAKDAAPRVRGVDREDHVAHQADRRVFVWETTELERYPNMKTLVRVAQSEGAAMEIYTSTRFGGDRRVYLSPATMTALAREWLAFAEAAPDTPDARHGA
jgi:hypothetical protein